jgi:hypothetical protein
MNTTPRVLHERCVLTPVTRHLHRLDGYVFPDARQLSVVFA